MAKKVANHVKDNWNTYLVAGLCVVTTPLGCAIATGVNIGYKALTGQYSGRAGVFDALVDAVFIGGGSALARGVAGAWSSKNVVRAGWKACSKQMRSPSGEEANYMEEHQKKLV